MRIVAKTTKTGVCNKVRLEIHNFEETDIATQIYIRKKKTDRKISKRPPM